MVRKREAMTADHGVRVVVDQSFELLLENERYPQPDPNALAELTWRFWRKSITRLKRFRTNSSMRAEAERRIQIQCELDWLVHSTSTSPEEAQAQRTRLLLRCAPIKEAPLQLSVPH